ncbi:MAG: GNAT family N-acetyltransferase [Saccharothrix sp.]|nr:GNAT family N-acetyltransferase [Saccharothrix sp.]
MTSNPEAMRTDRLVSRRVGPGDARATTTVLSDSGTDHTPPGPPSTAEAAGPVARWKVHRAHDGIGHRAVVLPETDEVIDSGSPHHQQPDGERTLDPYHHSRPRGWGHAHEAAHAAVKWAQLERPHRPALTTTDPDDKPSQHVAEKLGSAHAGIVPTPTASSTPGVLGSAHAGTAPTATTCSKPGAPGSAHADTVPAATACRTPGVLDSANAVVVPAGGPVLVRERQEVVMTA